MLDRHRKHLRIIKEEDKDTRTMPSALRKLVLSSIALAVCCAVNVSAGNLKVAVLASDSLTSSKRTLAGAQKVTRREHPEVEFVQFNLTSDPNQNAAITNAVRNEAPKLILTLGSSATSLARQYFTDIPIVFSGVKYPVLSGFVTSTTDPGGNITGASLDVPTAIQFSHFKKIVPGLKKIGLLYTQNTASLVPSAKIVARQAGLELVAVLVKDDRHLPAALDSLAGEVQGMWSVADPNLFKPKSTRYILLNSLRKGLPFMGFSRYVVESGALFALDFDYKAVGFQAGTIANRIINGEKPGNIDVTSADVIWFHYNENTAKRIDVTIPDELAAVAKEVYR